MGGISTPENSCGLYDLPLELLEMVCDELDAPDIASFRLLGKNFVEVGRKFLLRELSFFAHPRSVAKLVEISQHEYFAEKVKTVVYEDVELYESRNEGRVHRDLHPEEQCGRQYPLPTPDPFSRNQRLYSKLVLNYREYKDYPSTFDTISQALKRFKKLNRLELVQGFKKQRRAKLTEPGPFTAFALEERLWQDRRVYGSPYCQWPTSSSGDPWPRMCLYKALIMAALALPNADSLYLDLNPYFDYDGAWKEVIEGDTTFGSFLRDNVKELDFRYPSLQHLQRAHLWLDVDKWFSTDPASDGESTTPPLRVTEFPYLESLAIRPRRPERAFSTMYLGTLSHWDWPNLKRLELSNCSVKGSEFSGMLFRHARMLKHLELATIALVDDITWPQLLLDIKEMKVMKLRSARMTGLLISRCVPDATLGDELALGVWAIGHGEDTFRCIQEPERCAVSPETIARPYMGHDSVITRVVYHSRLSTFVLPKDIERYLLSADYKTPPINEWNVWWTAQLNCSWEDWRTLTRWS